MAMISVLIDHPKVGLILYEVGAGKDYPTVWGHPVNDIFARVDYVRLSLDFKYHETCLEGIFCIIAPTCIC